MVRLSSSIVLLRRAAAAAQGFEVLLVKRSAKMKAFSSLHVFPGGVREDVADAALASKFGEPDDVGVSKITGLRELFEEAGVLLTRGPSAPIARAHALGAEAASWQRKVHKHPEMFADLLEQHAQHPPLAELFYWVTFVTPLFERRRFTADFFVAIVDDCDIALDNGETVAYTWTSPAEAIAANAHGEMAFLPPQYYVLRTLCEAKGVDDLVARARKREAPVPILPHGVGLSEQGEVTLVYPGDEEHPNYPGLLGHRRRIFAQQPFGSGGYRWEDNLESEPTLAAWRERASKL